MSVRFVPLLVGLFAALALAAFSQTSVSVTYNYASISFPGAPVTHANGINNSNVIVGSYYDSKYFVHGFIYCGGKYTAVNFPGATMTEVLGINDNADIVGVYQLPGGLNFHGFLRHNGSFTKIDDPSAGFGTMAFGINKTGTIVGSYDNAQGFVYENGKYRTLNAPQLSGEPHQTQLNGINDQGWIAGEGFFSVHDNTTGVFHPILLIPVPEPGVVILLFFGGLTAVAWMTLRRQSIPPSAALRTCPPQTARSPAH